MRAAFTAAFDICADGALSHNERMALLAKAGWMPVSDVEQAADYLGEWGGIVRAFPTDANFADVLKTTRRQSLEFITEKGDALPVRVHPDWPGTLEPGPLDYTYTFQPDLAEGGQCLFLSGLGQPAEVPGGPMKATKPLARISSEPRPYGTQTIYSLTAEDTGARRWTVRTEVFGIDADLMTRRAGQDYGLRSALRISVSRE